MLLKFLKAPFTVEPLVRQPEILEVRWQSVTVFPLGQPAAGTFWDAVWKSLVRLEKGRRGTLALEGIVGGGLGETAYQTTSAMGAPKPVAIGASIVGGMLAPTALGQFFLVCRLLDRQLQVQEKLALVTLLEVLRLGYVVASLLTQGRQWSKLYVP
jgi:hypothetical protein